MNTEDYFGLRFWIDWTVWAQLHRKFLWKIYEICHREITGLASTYHIRIHTFPFHSAFIEDWRWILKFELVHCVTLKIWKKSGSLINLEGSFLSWLLLLTLGNLFVPRGNQVGVHLEGFKCWCKCDAVHTYTYIDFKYDEAPPNEVDNDDVHLELVHPPTDGGGGQEETLGSFQIVFHQSVRLSVPVLVSLQYNLRDECRL